MTPLHQLELQLSTQLHDRRLELDLEVKLRSLTRLIKCVMFVSDSYNGLFMTRHNMNPTDEPKLPTNIVKGCAYLR